MAKTKSTTHQRDSDRRTKNASPKDAIALLKADHRQVEEWFSEFEKARDSKRKAKLAEQICNALKVHMQIEEEIFYPAFLEATEDEEIHHEAEVEHNGAKRLIADLESQSPKLERSFRRARVNWKPIVRCSARQRNYLQLLSRTS